MFDDLEGQPYYNLVSYLRLEKLRDYQISIKNTESEDQILDVMDKVWKLLTPTERDYLNSRGNL
jgi:hypothetical protein